MRLIANAQLQSYLKYTDRVFQLQGGRTGLATGKSLRHHSMRVSCVLYGMRPFVKRRECSNPGPHYSPQEYLASKRIREPWLSTCSLPRHCRNPMTFAGQLKHLSLTRPVVIVIRSRLSSIMLFY